MRDGGMGVGIPTEAVWLNGANAAHWQHVLTAGSHACTWSVCRDTEALKRSYMRPLISKRQRLAVGTLGPLPAAPPLTYRRSCPAHLTHHIHSMRPSHHASWSGPAPRILLQNLVIGAAPNECQPVCRQALRSGGGRRVGTSFWRVGGGNRHSKDRLQQGAQTSQHAWAGFISLPQSACCLWSRAASKAQGAPLTRERPACTSVSTPGARMSSC